MYLTVPEVAKKLGVHRSTVHRWVSQGLLRPAMVVTQKRIVLLSPEAVDAARHLKRRSRKARRAYK